MLLSDNFVIEPPVTVSRQEIKTDLDYLIHFLKKGYGGRKYIPQDQFKNTLLKFDQLANSEINLEVKVFCEKMD